MNNINNMINMMYNNNNGQMMNNIGINPIGINNQTNLMNYSAMNTTTQNVKNIIEPYEKRIKELEEIIRQKDFEIAVLKQKLNNKKVNDMNINNQMNMANMNNPINMMNVNNQMNNPMNMFCPNIDEIIQKGKKLFLKVKFENNEYDIDCFQRDKASILGDKVQINKQFFDFVFNFKRIKMGQTFEENGIYTNTGIIEVKPIIQLIFIFNEIRYGLNLSQDCPLDIAIYHYLIELKDPFLLKVFANNGKKIDFIFNATRLNIKEETPLYKIFKNAFNTIHVISYGNLIIK